MRWQTTIVFLVGLACISLAIHLSYGIFREPLPIFPSVDFRQLQQEVKELEATVKIKEAKLADLDPGPEPARWHVIDHWQWQDKADIYHDLQSDIRQSRQNLEKTNQRLIEYVESFWPRQRERIWEVGRWLWKTFISRILHIFLILALIGLSTRVFFRWLLMADKFGATRV